MKTDVTDTVQRYRLALRHIWNSCFWVDPNLRNWDSVYAFRNLKAPLFRAVVAEPLEIEAADEIFGPGFQVVPENGCGLPMLEVNTWVPSKPDSGIWEPLPGPFSTQDLSLTLVDLFDWTPLGYIDLRYYVVVIESFPSRPDNVGQHALVDCTFVNVIWIGAAGDNAGLPTT